MVKYTRDDVIIWPDDERLIEGSKCYLGGDPKILLAGVNEDVIEELTFTGIACSITEGWLFGAKDGTSHHHSEKFIIMKKEPKKKIVPFDFSLEEDRNALMGKRIKSIATDMIVTDFACRCGYGWQVRIAPELGFDGEFLFTQFVFADGENAGKPVGKEVEEE